MSEIVIEKSIDVDAKPVEVWDALVDVNNWAEWKPFVESSSIAGGYDCLSNGSKIKFKLQVGGPVAVPLSARINKFDRPGLLSWEGGAKGLVHAEHSFEMIEKSGKTRVVTREVFSGALVPVMLLLVTRDDLEAVHEKWLSAIKNKMEGEPEAPADDHGHGH